MTLEGAIKFYEEDSYVIYTMNSATTGQYCVVLPKGSTGVMNMLVDLHMKESFGAVSGGTKTKEQLIEELKKEYLNIKIKYSNAMLVFPMIDDVFLQNAIIANDKQKMFDEVKKIGAITSEIYKKLTDSGVAKQNIDQKIIIVEKNENDGRFVAWLKEQMPNFVDGVLYSELEVKEVVMNPFVGNASVAPTPEVVVSTPSVGGSIFDTPNTPVAPVPPVSEPVVEAVPSIENANVDIFGIPNQVSGVTPDASSVVQSPIPEPVVPPVVNAVPETPTVMSTPAPVPTVETPQPINNVALEGTTTFSPISDPVQNSPEVAQVSEVEEEEPKKGSKGFVNLVILLVVLVGVTVASIELGKFLYSVYGA